MRREQNRRSCHRGMGIVLMACLVVGCGAQAQESAKLGPEKTIIKVMSLPVLPASVLIAAQQRGFFAAEGLQVQVTISASNSNIQKFKEGAYDIMLRDYISTLKDNESGFPGSMIQEVDTTPKDGFPVVVRRGSKIRVPADLRGKKIAINRRRNIAELSTIIALQVHGVEPRRDKVSFVEMSFTEAPKALAKGAVDAVWTFDPYLLILQKSGARVVLDTAVGPMAGFPLTVFASSREFARRHPNTVAAFKRAAVRAQRLLAEDRSLLEAAIANVLKTNRGLAAVSQSNPEFITTTTSNPVRIKRVADFMYQFGFLQKRVDVRTLIPAAPRPSR
jgi:NitT/TauT family transport system substrate-binding protein